MKLLCTNHGKGITIRFSGKKFSLSYPKRVWQAYPKETKDVLFDNLVHLSTINLPLVAGIERLQYDTSAPLFKTFFRTVVLNSLPHAVEDYEIGTQDITRQFLGTKYEFEDSNVKVPSYHGDVGEKAVVSFSCGKDSLLSLGVCHEIGLNPVSVYINDTVSPTENKLKVEFCRRISNKFGLRTVVVTNQLERLNDFYYWGREESCIGYTHMLTAFCLIVLPFTHYYKARYIVVGNQQDMNFMFRNKDGFLTCPSFDQTSVWMKQQDIMVRRMSSGKVRIMSVVEPLTNIAVVRLLHKRYKRLGEYQISCDSLDASSEKRWCHNCSKCARTSIMMKANDVDTKSVGFRSNLLGKRHRHLYSLFDGREVDCYEKSVEAKNEQLLAFYMAYRNGERGYLLDSFRKKFLKDAQAKEDYLIRKFFFIYTPTRMPTKIKKDVLSIFSEELK